MREGWNRTRLGDVLTQVHRPVVVAELDEVPFAGVRWYSEGVYHRDTVDPASVKTRTLNRLRSGDVTYNRMWATKSSFGVVRDDADQCLVTNDFPIFEVEETRTSSDYIGLLFHWAPFREQAAAAATGTTERRRLNERQFVEITVPLPPLDEQRRIVDLVGALDETIAAAERQLESNRSMEGPLIERMLHGEVNWPRPTLGEVGTFIRGRRFTKSEYVEQGLGCIHYGQVHTQLGAVTERPLTFLEPEARTRLRLARPGDVVVTATSEDVEGLGKATTWLGDEVVAVHDDCYIFQHQLDPVFASFVFRSPAFQAQKVQYAAGTKVTRISGANLARITVPVPPMETQRRIGETLRAVEAQATLLRVGIDRLQILRSNLLTALLSGEHPIPESYDEVMEDVAA